MWLRVVVALLVVGFIHPVWWMAAGVVLLGWVAYRGYLIAATEVMDEGTEAMQLSRAGDEQDLWWVQGDPRGVHGSYPPSIN